MITCSDYPQKLPQTSVIGNVKPVWPDWLSLPSVSGSVCVCVRAEGLCLRIQ